MPVQRSTLNIPIGGGIDLSTDPKSVTVPNLRDLQNAAFDLDGAYIKRPGYERIAVKDLEGNTISDPLQVLPSHDGALLRTRDKLYSFNPDTKGFREIGPFIGGVPTVDKLVQQPGNQSNVDVAENQGITVVAWDDAEASAVQISIISRGFGLTNPGHTTILDKFTLAANSTRPRCVAVGNVIWVLYLSSATTIHGVRVLVADPALVTSFTPVAITSSVHSGGKYNVDSGADSFALTYLSGATQNTLSTFDADGNDISPMPLTFQGLDVMGVRHSPDESAIWVGGWQGGTGYIFEYSKTSLALISSASTAIAGTPTNAIVIPTGVNASYLIIESPGFSSLATDTLVYLAAPGSLTLQQTLSGVGLASKGYAIGDRFLFWTAVNYTLQSGSQLCDHEGNRYGRVLYGEGQGLTTSGYLPSVVLGTDNAATTVQLYQERLATEFDEDLGRYNVQRLDSGVAKVVLEHDAQLQSLEVPGGTQISGFGSMVYDGAVVKEQGFWFYPEATIAVGAAGALTGDYLYRVYYEEIDNLGKIVRSTYAENLSVTLTADRAEISIPAFYDTRKTEVRLGVYRTRANPTVQSPFYRASGYDTSVAGANGWFQMNTGSSVLWVDNMTDAVLETKELDPNNVELFDNLAAPNGRVLTSGQGRYFIAGGEDANTVFYSKLPDQRPGAVNNRAIEWNPGLRSNIPSDGGPITAMAAFDQALVVFKRNRAYALFGAGPNNFGAGGYQSAQLVTPDTGCVKQSAVAQVPGGIVFQSTRGPYYMDQNFALKYIGKRVAPLISCDDVTAVLSLSDRPAALFIYCTGRALYWDWSLDNWSTWLNCDGPGATVVNDKILRITNKDKVLLETPGQFTDDGAVYSMVLRLPFIRVNNSGSNTPRTVLQASQDRQYIYKILILGDWKSEHKIQTSVGYDYKGITDVKVWNPADAYDLSQYGSSGYGSGSYGGSGGQYQMVHHTKQKRSQAIDLEIRDIQASAEAMRISGVTVEYGYMGLGHRLPAANDAVG